MTVKKLQKKAKLRNAEYFGSMPKVRKTNAIPC